MWQLFSSFGIFLMALISPGPDFSIVMKNSLAYGKKAGILSALGIATGCLIHVSICVFALSFFLAQQQQLIFWLRVLGCIYLMYLGVRCLLSKPSASSETATKIKTKRSWYFEGLLTNLLNAKAVLFFVSIFSTLVMQNPLRTICWFGVAMAISALTWFSCVSFLFSIHAMNQAFIKNAVVINRVLGVVLILFGLRIILS